MITNSDIQTLADQVADMTKESNTLQNAIELLRNYIYDRRIQDIIDKIQTIITENNEDIKKMVNDVIS